MTIIIPAYNCSKTLGRTLNSLVQQKDSNFSVVVVNDCSTEDLDTIISKYTNKLNIRVVYTSENQGCGGARQRGIEAVGRNDDYIAFLDADDILLPNAIELWRQHTHKGYDVIFTPFLIREPGKSTVRPFRFYPTGCAPFMTHGKVYSTKFISDNNIYSEPKIRYFFNDYFLNHQVFNMTENILFLEDFTYVYIKTEGSATMVPARKQQMTKPMRKLCLDELKKIFESKNIEHKELVYKANEKKMITTHYQACQSQQVIYKKIIVKD